MATQTHPEGKARSFGQNIESDLASRFLRVVEVAAIASARTMGQGERKLSDQVATEAMRHTMDCIPMRGTIVIGEGERDEAPMLYIGEEVGDGAADAPAVDIAVDPLEGTNLCASGAPGALAVVAMAEHGRFLNAPDTYMEKIAVGPNIGPGVVDIRRSATENLAAIARKKGVDVVPGRKRHSGVIRVPRLHNHPPRRVAAAGAPRHLDEELEGALARPEVGDAQRGVRVDDADDGHSGQVVALRDHLRPDEDVDLA
jgi:fructose-1,6-bisphosphatase II